MKIIDIKCNGVNCGSVYYETYEIKDIEDSKYYFFLNNNSPAYAVYVVKVEDCSIVNKGSYDELIIENRGN